MGKIKLKSITLKIARKMQYIKPVKWIDKMPNVAAIILDLIELSAFKILPAIKIAINIPSKYPKK